MKNKLKKDFMLLQILYTFVDLNTFFKINIYFSFTEFLVATEWNSWIYVNIFFAAFYKTKIPYVGDETYSLIEYIYI